MLNIIVGAVGIACIAKLVADMCGQKMPKDNGIVWNTQIEKRMAVHALGRKVRTAEVEANDKRYLLSSSKIKH